MMNVFSKDEVDEILRAKDTIRTYVHSSIAVYEWAAGVLRNGLSEPHEGLSGNFYISGGAIASLLLKEPPKDFDIYCRNERLVNSLQDALIKNYRDQIKDAYHHLEHTPDKKYRDIDCWKVPGKMVTEKSITMKNNMSFIVMQHGEPDKIKSTFDFLHCTPHYDIAEDKLYISRAQFDSILNKKLVVNNLGLVTPWRLQKFIDRGWSADQELIDLASSNKKLTPVWIKS